MAILVLLVVILIMVPALSAVTAYAQTFRHEELRIILRYENRQLNATFYLDGNFLMNTTFKWDWYGITEDTIAVTGLHQLDPEWWLPGVVTSVRRITVSLLSDKYKLLVSLDMFATQKNDTYVSIDFTNAPRFFIKAMEEQYLYYWMLMIIYDPSVFMKADFYNVTVLYDVNVRQPVFKAVTRALSALDKMKEEIGPSVFYPRYLLLVGSEIPDLYSPVGYAHSMGGILIFMKDRGDNINDFSYYTVTTLHEMGHGWFMSPYTADSPYILKQGGSEYTAWYFAMRYFPEVWQNFSNPGLCGAIMNKAPHVQDPLKVFELDYYIRVLSSSLGVNLTFYDVYSAMIASINENLAPLYVTFKDFITVELPRIISNVTGVRASPLASVSEGVYDIIMSDHDNSCEYPFVSNETKEAIGGLVASLINPSQNMRVYAIWDGIGTNITIYNFNLFPVNLTILTGLKGLEAVALPRDVTTIYINGVAPDDIQIYYQEPLTGELAVLEFQRLMSYSNNTIVVTVTSTTTTTTTQTYTQTETTTETITNTVSHIEYHTVVSTTTKTETYTVTSRETVTETKTETHTRTLTSILTIESPVVVTKEKTRLVNVSLPPVTKEITRETTIVRGPLTYTEYAASAAIGLVAAVAAAVLLRR